MTGTVESLRDWAAETPGASHEPVRPSESFTRRRAKTLTPEGQARLERMRGHRSPEAFRAVVPAARLVDLGAPLVLTGDRRLVAESAYEHLRSPSIAHPGLYRARQLGGRYMTLLNQWSENHFHWFADTLPRASLLPLEAEPETPIIVPTGLSASQLESLAMIGIPRERLLPLPHRHLQVDELVFPSFVGQPGFPPPWAVRWLRDRLAPPPNRPGQRRLWVSRAAATRGRVANEQAVLSVLSDYGFEAVQPEKHDLAEQLRMFADARVIVAPHGSGVTNILASRDATVIELQSERWWGRGCYYALADALDLDYWFLMCEVNRREHLVVDPELLRGTVDAALEGRQA